MVLTPWPHQFLALDGAVGSNSRKILGRSARADQFHHLPPEVRRIRIRYRGIVAPQKQSFRVSTRAGQL
jgi:hypothetical protein